MAADRGFRRARTLTVLLATVLVTSILPTEAVRAVDPTTEPSSASEAPAVEPIPDEGASADPARSSPRPPRSPAIPATAR